MRFTPGRLRALLCWGPVGQSGNGRHRSDSLSRPGHQHLARAGILHARGDDGPVEAAH